MLSAPSPVPPQGLWLKGLVKVDVAQQPKQGVGVWQGVDLRKQQPEVGDELGEGTFRGCSRAGRRTERRTSASRKAAARSACAGAPWGLSGREFVPVGRARWADLCAGSAPVCSQRPRGPLFPRRAVMLQGCPASQRDRSSCPTRITPRSTSMPITRVTESSSDNTPVSTASSGSIGSS
jgi:hypothetical protein